MSSKKSTPESKPSVASGIPKGKPAVSPKAKKAEIRKKATASLVAHKLKIPEWAKGTPADLKLRREAMMRKHRASNIKKYLVWAEGLKTMPHKTMVKRNVKNVPRLEKMFGVEVPVVLINGETYAIRDKKDGKFYLAGTKTMPTLKPGDMIDLPYSKGSYKKLMASAREAGVKTREMMAKRAADKAREKLLAKDPSKLTLLDLSKLTTDERRSRFIKPDGTVDFKGNKVASDNVALRHLFGKETPYLFVGYYSNKHKKKPKGEGLYAELGKDGKYYDVTTGKKVVIYTDDSVKPAKEIDVARHKQELERERSVKREMLARRRKAPREKVEQYAKRLSILEKYAYGLKISHREQQDFIDTVMEKFPKLDFTKKFLASCVTAYEKRQKSQSPMFRESLSKETWLASIKEMKEPTPTKKPPKGMLGGRTAIAAKERPGE